jgi:hypothetical protein
MAQETEKVRLDFSDVRKIIEFSDKKYTSGEVQQYKPTDYLLLEYKILYSSMNCDAIFLKIERKRDNKIFYGIFEFIEETPEEFGLEILIQELIKYSEFYKTPDLEFCPYKMEQYYKIQDKQKDLSPIFCDMSVPMSEIFELFGDSGEMHIVVEEKEIPPEEAYQLPEWEG